MEWKLIQSSGEGGKRRLCLPIRCSPFFLSNKTDFIQGGRAPNKDCTPSFVFQPGVSKYWYMFNNQLFLTPISIQGKFSYLANFQATKLRPNGSQKLLKPHQFSQPRMNQLQHMTSYFSFLASGTGGMCFSPLFILSSSCLEVRYDWTSRSYFESWSNLGNDDDSERM